MQDENGDPRHDASLSARRPRLSGRVRAYVGLGANLGDPEAALVAAVHALAALQGVRLRGVSPLYRTKPVGVTDQPEFVNAVAALDAPAGPDPATGALALLVALKQLERAFGRGEGERWGPRVIDLDLLIFGRHRLRLDRPPEGLSIDPIKAASPDGRILEVPHASASGRLFVLAPLADLAPRLVPPGWPTTIETQRRRQRAVEGPDAVREVGTWDSGRRRWIHGGRRPSDQPRPRPRR